MTATASQNRPVVLLGLDGATYSILNPLIAEGKLPNLSRLKREGASGVLQSTIHPITPAAWVSMVTGLNPGKHGVYDFRRRIASSYNWELVNSQSWSGDTIWANLGRQGKKVGVFNVPMTYPPDPVNGFMITGLGTPPRSENFIYPSSLSTRFQERFPDYVVDPGATTTDVSEYLPLIEQSTDRRIEALRFVRNENPDLAFLMAVFIEPDRIHHVAWQYFDPTMPGYHEPSAAKLRGHMAAIYQKIDAVLGELWDWVAARRGYMVVASDHGFGPLVKDVYMNRWLLDRGYLAVKPDAGPHNEGHFFEQVDWERTSAYSFGFFGNVSLNLHGREPCGIVEPGREAEDLKREIINHLSRLTDPETGERIVDTVYRKEELYSGIHVDQAPDLLMVMKDYAYMTRDGFDFNSDQLVGMPMEHNKQALPHSGNHRLEGIVLMAGEGIKPGTEIQGAVITDVAPTVLYVAEAPIPTGLDGQVLLNAFDASFVSGQPPIYQKPEATGTTARKPLRVQLLERDVQIHLLETTMQKMQRVIAEKDQKILHMEDLIERFKNGKMMRLLAWLQRARRIE